MSCKCAKFHSFIRKGTIFTPNCWTIQKEEVQKVEKLHFSKGVNPWYWSKNANYSNFFFLAIQARKISFTIFQTEKKPFQAIKTESSNRRKLDIFPKGLTHAFGPKLASFGTFFFQAIQGSKMSFTIFQNEKTPFQAIKIRGSKSRKIDIFSKWLTHCFGPKMGISATFFFRHYSIGKCPLRYFRTKKRLSRL